MAGAPFTLGEYRLKRQFSAFMRGPQERALMSPAEHVAHLEKVHLLTGPIVGPQVGMMEAAERNGPRLSILMDEVEGLEALGSKKELRKMEAEAVTLQVTPCTADRSIYFV